MTVILYIHNFTFAAISVDYRTLASHVEVVVNHYIYPVKLLASGDAK